MGNSKISDKNVSFVQIVHSCLKPKIIHHLEKVKLITFSDFARNLKNCLLSKLSSERYMHMVR